MNKYRNVKHNGFDSKKEERRYYILKQMQDRGEITDLMTQVKFQLIPSQYIDGKCVERPCSYIADFTYRKDGEFIAEDVKGYTRKNPEYIIKRKLMLEKYGIKINEV